MVEMISPGNNAGAGNRRRWHWQLLRTNIQSTSNNPPYVNVQHISQISMQAAIHVSIIQHDILKTHPVARAIGEFPSMRIWSSDSDETVYLSLGTSVTDTVGTVWFPVSRNLKLSTWCGSLLLTNSSMPWVEYDIADPRVTNVSVVQIDDMLRRSILKIRNILSICCGNGRSECRSSEF